MTEEELGAAGSAAARRPWPDALWIAVPVLAGLVQLLRGEAADAVVFLVPAFLLAADSAGALPRIGGPPRTVTALLPAGTVAAGAVLALTPRHGPADGAAVVLLGVAVLSAAWPDPAVRAPAADAPFRRSAAIWATLALAVAVWELLAFLLGLPSAAASLRHPAISDLLDPVADVPIGRAGLVAAWALAGLALLRRGR